MFRRLPSGLPKDASYPADLRRLGYQFVEANGNCQIVGIDPPHAAFRYTANDNERHNEVRCEAIHECVRQQVIRSLLSLDLALFNLPQLKETSRPAPHEPTLPILLTPNEHADFPLSTRSRVVVIINSRTSDLGILSHPKATGPDGINGGSMHALVQAITTQLWPSVPPSNASRNNSDTPGIVILNPGQTYFSHTHPAHPAGTAMTARSWQALPRPSGLHDAPKVHPIYNRIPNNESAEAHLRYCFSPAVLGNPALVHPRARLLIIAVTDCADELLRMLAEKQIWTSFGPRISALALAAPSPIPTAVGVDFLTPNVQHDDAAADVHRKEAFRKLLAERTRAWCLSPEALGTPLANAKSSPLNVLASRANASDVDELAVMMAAAGLVTEKLAPQDGEIMDDVQTEVIVLWTQVSGGEAQNVEDVLPVAHGDVVKWLVEVEKGGDDYVNPVMDVSVDLAAHADGAKKDWEGWEQDLAAEAESRADVAALEAKMPTQDVD